MSSTQHHQYTDEELDRDWVPNGRRPQSTIARSFSQELGDIFRIENSISDLDGQVDEKRQIVGQGNRELASIEARIKQMEERLRKNQKAHPELAAFISLPPRPPTGDEKGASAQGNKSRPGTARPTHAAPSSGNMPPTPGASEDGDRE